MAKVEFHDLVCRLKALANELGKTPTNEEFIASGQSKRQILKHKYSEIVKAAGLEANKYSQTTDPVEIIRKPPKILCFDLELAPLLLEGWGLYDQNFGLNQIVQDWSILSYAAKFLHKDKIYYKDVRKLKNKENDKDLILTLHELISEADILLGHNIDKFDLKKINTRFIFWGLDPIPPRQTIDTLKIARRHFSFTSNKLEYLAKFLKCQEKLSHSKFSGHTLWRECLKGNQEAFKEMELYNKQDVLTTIEVYEKLIRYDNSINFQIYEQKRICTCGSTEFFKNGMKYQKAGIFQIYRCSKCGKCFVDKENFVDKNSRKELFK
jgi:DNA polymerase elongation subunit (family B)